MIQDSGQGGRDTTVPGVVYDLQLFLFLCVFSWATAVGDIELQLYKDICYLKLLVFMFSFRVLFCR